MSYVICRSYVICHIHCIIVNRNKEYENIENPLQYYTVRSTDYTRPTRTWYGTQGYSSSTSTSTGTDAMYSSASLNFEL
jgi:hypothetical protein